MLCVPTPPKSMFGALPINLTMLDGVQSLLFPSPFKTTIDSQYYLLINQWCYDNALVPYSRFFPSIILLFSMISLITSNVWFKFPGTRSKIELLISVLSKCLNSPWTIKALSQTVYEEKKQHIGEMATVATCTKSIPSASVAQLGRQKIEPQILTQGKSVADDEEYKKQLLTHKPSNKLAAASKNTRSSVKILDKKEGEQAKALFEKVKMFQLHTEGKDILFKIYKSQAILRLLEATVFLLYVSVSTPKTKHVIHCIEPLNVTGYTHYYCVHGLWGMFYMLSISCLCLLGIYIFICAYTVYWILSFTLKDYSFETIRKETGIDDIPDVKNDFAFLLHLIDQHDKLYSWKFAVFLSDVSETKLLQINLNHFWTQEKLKQCLATNSKGKTELCLSMLPGIPIQVFNLREIEVLKLESMQSLTLISAVSNLKLLKEIWVYNSRIKLEPQALVFLKTNLDILHVSFTAPDEIPSWMYSLARLQKLYIQGQLQLGNKSIITLQSFKELTQLKFLSIKLYISKLPSAILHLAPTLRGLTIHNDGSKLNLPSNLKKFTNLTHLCLIYCQLDHIPDYIFSLVNLQELDLSSNNLTSVEELNNLQRLKKLRSLLLSKNMISNIPTDIANLANLEVLHLNGNCLITMSTGIFKLKNLCNLDLSKNEIDALSPMIGQLADLEYLSLSNNQLTSLPDELFSCTKIQTLLLSHNQISFLSPLIKKLTVLSFLDLTDNQLKKLPVELENCFNLKKNQLLVEKELFKTLPQDVRKKIKNSSVDCGGENIPNGCSSQRKSYL